jgi:hypothetical protein
MGIGVQLLDSMRAQGRLKPNAFVFNAAISACDKVRRCNSCES